MNVLNVALSFVFIYLVFAIVVCGVQEWWAQYFAQRGKFLKLGMQRLIDDEAVFVRVLQQPLVGGLYRDRAAKGQPPSYVEPTNFALALVSVLQSRAGLLDSTQAFHPLTFQTLRNAAEIMRNQKSPVAESLIPILDQANSDLGTALKGIESWFAGGMDRVSGWYKGFAQRRLFVIGLLIAIFANVDTIAIYRSLNAEPALAAQIADTAAAVNSTQQIGGVDLSKISSTDLTPEQSQAVLRAALATPLNRLPFGYSCISPVLASAQDKSSLSPVFAVSGFRGCGEALWGLVKSWSFSDWVIHSLGWILTALAGTLGAPYWFSMLSKIVSVRGSGPKPKISA